MKWLAFAAIAALPLAALLASHLSHAGDAAPLPRLIPGHASRQPAGGMRLAPPRLGAAK